MFISIEFEKALADFQLRATKAGRRIGQSLSSQYLTPNLTICFPGIQTVWYTV